MWCGVLHAVCLCMVGRSNGLDHLDPGQRQVFLSRLQRCPFQKLLSVVSLPTPRSLCVLPAPLGFGVLCSAS